jgi:hypothetical protein
VGEGATATNALLRDPSFHDRPDARYGHRRDTLSALSYRLGGNANTYESLVGRRRVCAVRSVYGPGRQELLAQATAVAKFVPKGELTPIPRLSAPGHSCERIAEASTHTVQAKPSHWMDARPRRSRQSRDDAAAPVAFRREAIRSLRAVRASAQV